VWQLLVREPLLAGDVSEYLAGSHFFSLKSSFFLTPSLSHHFFLLKSTFFLAFPSQKSESNRQKMNKNKEKCIKNVQKKKKKILKNFTQP
jgi:hypothetical protein